MYIEQVISAVAVPAKLLWDFANTTFFSSLSGAFAGAYGGQLIVEKIKNRETLLTEIRNTNAAIMMAFDICNSYVSLKKQYVKALKETFAKQRQDLNKYHADLKSGQIPATDVFHFQADLGTLETMLMPIEVLQ